MRKIAFISQKGGSGKTTSTINIGAGLYRQGKKVLLLDMDPQACLSYSLGIPVDKLEKTLYQVIMRETRPANAILGREFGLDILPASPDLSKVETELAGNQKRGLRLIKAMKELKGQYDYVLLDCPPALGLLTIMSLIYAREVIIPLQVEFLALRGLSWLIDAIKVIKERLNPRLRVTGIIACRYDGRRNLNKKVISSIRKHFGDLLFDTYIRENIALAEAPSFGQTIFEYNMRSHGAEDYMDISNKIIETGHRGKKQF